MQATKTQKIFEKYNPESAVKRCPNGRSPVRALLDEYAKAAINLYGFIPITDFVDIFNSIHEEKTTVDEVFTLLLPLVLKKKWYCFYKDHIVHYWAIDDFSFADEWIELQKNKPRYIPEAEDFLKYMDEYYEDAVQERYWKKVDDFIHATWPHHLNASRLYNDLKDLPEFGSGLNEANELFEKYKMEFQNENQFHEFFALLIEANNNTRLWSNNGNTPLEMRKYSEQEQAQLSTEPVFNIPSKKIGPNEPCPCGSGKKYKKCCRLKENLKTAQLPTNEVPLFYDTWYKLLAHVNEQKKLIKKTIKPIFPRNPISDNDFYTVREYLWKNPDLILDFIEVGDLTDEQKEILISWHKHHKVGQFFLIEYNDDYAMLIGEENQKDIVYGVKGLTRSLAAINLNQAPLQVETVLLPFKGKIVYDTFLASSSAGFGDGAKQMFKTMADNYRNKVILTLE